MTVDWRSYALPETIDGDLAALADPAFAQLESAVFDHLANSWCSQAKARLLLELVVLSRPQVCVEIGAFTGSTTLPVAAGLRHVGQGRACVIEPWSNEEALRGLPDGDANALWWADVDMAAVRAQFAQLLAAWSLASWCEVLAEASRDAAAKITAIDMLHLDGNFSEQGSLLDSELYVPKVAVGGHIVLSNALVTVAGKPAKMRALWPLFDTCDVVCELDDGNTLMFRKR
jgi:hypothetical protein